MERLREEEWVTLVVCCSQGKLRRGGREECSHGKLEREGGEDGKLEREIGEWKD